MSYIRQCDIKPGNYFPMFLGNGVDGVLIDWTGSMGFKDHFSGVFCYWYKTGRYLDPKNGNFWAPSTDPVPIIRSSYILKGEESQYEIGQSVQKFDSQQAILHTTAQATDYELEIETYLTSDHLLVEHYRVKRAPSWGKREMVILLNDRRTTYTGKLIQKIDVKYANVGEQIFAHYKNENFTGGARMWIEKIKGNFVIEQSAQLKAAGGITLKQIKAGDEFVRYLCVVDNMDNEDYLDFSNAIYIKTKRNGIKGIRSSHIEEWQKYSKTSNIKLGDESIENMYHLSLYLIRAMQHPEKGFIALNFFPTNHGGRTYWDSWFCHKALLYANKVTEAEKAAFFWKRILPISRNYASIWGATKGARFGWSVTPEGESPDLHADQFHNNGVVVISAWEQYEYTSDKKILQRLYPVIKEGVEFLIEKCIEEKENLAVIRPMESLDETLPRENCTWTLAVTLKAIQILIEANKILGYKSDPHLSELTKKLSCGFKLNRIEDVLYPYKPFKERLPHLNAGSILPFWLFPELYNKKTLDTYLQDAKELDGLGWGKGSRMRCRICPWAEAIASATLAQGKDLRAYEHLLKVISCTNSYGGIPEYLWFSYNVSREWYLTAHSTFIIALRNILISEEANKVYLLQTIPKKWQNIHIRDFRLKEGLLLSLQVENGVMRELTLKNASGNNIEREFVLGRISEEKIIVKVAAGKEKKLSLKSKIDTFI